MVACTVFYELRTELHVRQLPVLHALLQAPGVAGCLNPGLHGSECACTLSAALSQGVCIFLEDCSGRQSASCSCSPVEYKDVWR